MSDAYSTIKKPIISEKSINQTEAGVYTFAVSKRSNKIEIAKAVEKMFQVKVADVRIINVPAKKRVRGRTVGKVPSIKKAIVKLKSGKINIFGKV